MSRPSPTSGTFADRIRAWVRDDPRRFQAYGRLREALHWLQWRPFHALRLVRRGWNFLYWIPYRVRPALWKGTRYARMAEAGFPPAPVHRAFRWLAAFILRQNLLRVGSYEPVRQADAEHLAQRMDVLVPPQVLELAAPRVFGTLPPGWPAPWPDLRVPMDAVTVAEWSDATVFGRFDTILVGRHCIVGDLWQPGTERTYDEVRDYARPEEGRIAYYRKKGGTRAVDRAILALGGTTTNWAHWTTEYLPKVALAHQLEAYAGWPLLVDEGLHANIEASLQLVAPGRELVRVPEGQLTRVGRAVSVGSPGYTAYEYRYDPYSGPPLFRREHTVFSPAALDLVRRRAWASTDARPQRSRLIYITRPKGSMRPFIGGEEVERFFAEQGFEIVDTSGMSAADQVRLFARARCIAGPSGAGLANLVFAPPGCRVLVFTSNSAHSIFHYFANMGAAAGHRVYYCYGESIFERGGHPAHAGFSVPLADAQRMWQAVLEDEPATATQE